MITKCLPCLVLAVQELWHTAVPAGRASPERRASTASRPTLGTSVAAALLAFLEMVGAVPKSPEQVLSGFYLEF